MGLPSSSNQSQGQSTFTMLSTLSGSGGLPCSSGANPLGIGIPTSSMVASAAGQAGIGTSELSGIASGSPGAVNGPRIGIPPTLGLERRTGDASSVLSDMAQAVSKVSLLTTKNNFTYLISSQPNVKIDV